MIYGEIKFACPKSRILRYDGALYVERWHIARVIEGIKHEAENDWWSTWHFVAHFRRGM